jgi:hypothetical protein
MTTKRYFITVATIVLAAAVSVILAGRISVGQADGLLAGSLTTQTGNWEYRILSESLYNLQTVSIRTTRPGQPLPLPPTLEQTINDLALQGYQVESFQVTSPIRGDNSQGGLTINSQPTVVVLMKRTRR